MSENKLVNLFDDSGADVSPPGSTEELHGFFHAAAKELHCFPSNIEMSRLEPSMQKHHRRIHF